MADKIFGAETLATEQAVIAALVQRELIEGAQVAPNVLDVSAFAEDGAKSIDFPRAGSFTVQKKKKDEQAQAQVVTYSTDQLDLDQHAVVQWILPKRGMKQSRIALEADTIARAARAHAKQVDEDIIAAMEAGAAAANAVSLSGTFGREEITEMRRKLRAQNVPMSDLTLAVAPEFEEDMLNTTDFIDASKYGDRMPVLNGEIGRVFGARVVVSTLLTASTAMMFHREALALGFQMQPELDSDKDLEHLGTRYSLDQLYGHKVLNNGLLISRCS